MKTFFKVITLGVLLCCFGACKEDNTYADNTPKEITYAQVAGCWQLTEWSGESWADADATKPFFYIILERREDPDRGVHTFEIYQNIDSSKSRYLTGSYELEYDEDKGTFISGIYDHDAGAWTSEYLISAFTSSVMTWIVTDDATDVSIYTRRSSVPDDIKNAAMSAE